MTHFAGFLGELRWVRSAVSVLYSCSTKSRRPKTCFPAFLCQNTFVQVKKSTKFFYETNLMNCSSGTSPIQLRHQLFSETTLFQVAMETTHDHVEVNSHWWLHSIARLQWPSMSSWLSSSRPFVFFALWNMSIFWLLMRTRRPGHCSASQPPARPSKL